LYFSKTFFLVKFIPFLKVVSPIIYQIENDLSVEDFRTVLENSTLAQRRPVEDTERLTAMLKNANLIITARAAGKIVGVSRAITDFVYCTYLSDLAVDESCQKNGIGKELIRQTKLAAPQAKLILLSAPKAVGYYPKIGMKRHEHCYFMDNIEELN
jgi:predicted N-acetyltransferase YhbS